MFATLLAVVFVPNQLDAVQAAIKKMDAVEFAYEGEFLRLDGKRTSRVNPPFYKFNGTMKIKAAAPLVVMDHRKPHGDDFMESRASYTPKRGAYTYKLASKKTPLGSEIDGGGFN
jgi:hypothetical protein